MLDDLIDAMKEGVEFGMLVMAFLLTLALSIGGVLGIGAVLYQVWKVVR